jgi:hypothetical protein
MDAHARKEGLSMRKIFFAGLLSLISLFPAAEAATPPGFDVAKWELLLKRVELYGEDYGSEPELRFFSHLVPHNKEIPHTADYFGAYGAKDTEGKFHAYEVSVVSEDWRKQENNNWEIEQWIFRVRLNGELAGVTHTLLIEEPSGRVLDIRSLPVGAPDSPEEIERWGGKLSEWLKRY